MTIAGPRFWVASALQAAGRRSEPVEIPFDFTVHGKQLPAGTYRLQKGTAIVSPRWSTCGRASRCRSCVAGSERQSQAGVRTRATATY